MMCFFLLAVVLWAFYDSLKPEYKEDNSPRWDDLETKSKNHEYTQPKKTN